MSSNITTHSLRIGISEYFVQGGDTNTLKEIADKLELKYDSLEPSKLSATQGLIKIWAIGELADFLNPKYILKKARPTGGKAGTGHNKTSTLQIFYNQCAIKHIRYNVGDYDSYKAAKEKALKYIGKDSFKDLT